MKKIVTPFILVLIFTYSNAQNSWMNGEIHLKNGTVLKGVIKLPKVPKSIIKFNPKERVRFRNNIDGKTSRHGASHVSQILFKSGNYTHAVYEYIPVSKTRNFLFKVVKTGNVNLYMRIVNIASYSGPMHTMGPNGTMTWTNSYAGSSTFEEFYVKREGEEDIASALVTASIFVSFKSRALEYFSDCPDVVSKIENETLGKKNVSQIVDEYNQCKKTKANYK